MTREEAITRLHWLKRELIKGTDMNEPIDMAISALSKADTTENPKCKDCKFCAECIMSAPDGQWKVCKDFEPSDLMSHEDAWNTIDNENKSADSLLTEDKDDSKEQKSKLDHDREWIIGCIKHDGFIKTDRFDKANQIILNALEQTDTDLISRADAVNAVHKYFVDLLNDEPYETDEDGDEVFTDMKSVNALFKHNKAVSKALKALPSAETTGALDDAIVQYVEDGYMLPPSADRPITSGYIADDKEVPPYTTTSAVSADRPTIVRCKDCKYYENGENEVDSWECCTRKAHSTSREDFCSWGERKGGEEE